MEKQLKEEEKLDGNKIDMNETEKDNINKNIADANEAEKDNVKANELEKDKENTTDENKVEYRHEKRKSKRALRKEARRLEQQRKKEEEDKLIVEIAMAQAELNALKEEHGLMEEEKGVKKWITNFFDKQEGREKVLVNKKKYLIATILLGWMGIHRFWAKQYGLGLLYLLTCWTGFPVSLVVIDVLVIIPMQPDENGNILV